MKHYAVILNMLDEEKSQTYRPQHLAYLEEKQKAGKIFAYGRFFDGSGGMVIYRVASEEELQQLVAADPYVAEGARTPDIREWAMNTEAVLPDNG